ncbi:MFS transporter [Jatrophihabitans sp. GAS493]|uniref:MFS transporter n=1 Tax=Jatrophihabitans sp. GAS493 TaxID=1907575 RepID=UPI000BC082B5|nr:MFS transporter [Jatrophihabitans sp. GAS493]SOD72212.1 MFS transporter [Jatrophihabitans sp. GAS493]
MIRRLLPAEPVERALSLATVTSSLSKGVFFTVSALYFTRVVGLPATTVGIGLTIAGACGVATSFVGGRLSDVLGADRVQAAALAAQGVALFAYLLAGGPVSFTLIACCAVGFSGLQGTSRAVLLARWFVGPQRVAVRARMRVLTNVSIGVGTCAAGLALVAGTADSYRLSMAIVGALTISAALPLLRLRRDVPLLGRTLQPDPVGPDDDNEVSRTHRRSPFTDRTYLISVGFNSVIAMQFGVQTVGVPLWVATRTSAPTAMISVLLLVNTVFVALFQVRASRGTHDVAIAGRTVRRAGFTLAVSCLLYAASASGGTVVAIVILLLAALAGALAEVWAEAGGWGLAFELADPGNVGAYQGLSQTGYSLAAMLAPAVVAATAIRHGTAGWAILGATFVLAGCVVATVAGYAAARRPEPELALTG